jgi:hypothetical protein
MSTETIQELREYYHVASLVLRRTHLDFEKHLEEKAEEIYESLQAEDKREILTGSHDLHHIQVQAKTTLRYAFLPRYLGLLERMVKGICKAASPSEYQNIDQRGWLKSHTKFLRTIGVSFDGLEDRIKLVRNLIHIRDCIVHANGEIEACTKPQQVRKAIESVETAEVFPDGFVFLGDHVISKAQTAMSRIMKRLFEHFECPLDLRRF